MLGQRLKAKFFEAQRARREYEERWLRDLRLHEGVYDPEIAAAIPADRSHAFIRLVRTKVKTMDARMLDMLFPATGSRNWSIEPTPKPDIGPLEEARLAEELQRQGQPVSRETLDTAAEHLVEQRAEAMTTAIADQLIESRYQAQARDCIHSGNLFGTGILKGPLVEARVERRWRRTGEGFALSAEERIKPFVEYVPIWDVYPDLSARTLDSAEYVFQRHVMARHEVRKLMRRPDFSAEAIEGYLARHRENEVDPLTFETQLNAINGAKDAVNAHAGRRYEVLEYWGYVDGRDLVECGCEVPEEVLEREYEANVWLLGDEVIKATLNPFDAQTRPYHFFCFERDDTSLYGTGIAAIMRDPAMMFNASVRAAVDNAAISAGPILEVNEDMLLPGEDPTTAARPFRVLTRKNKDAASPAVRAYTIRNNTAALIQLAEVFKAFGEEASAIPAYVQGENSGAGATAAGLSMLMGAANITMKDTVRNFDQGVIEPLVRALYHWNMQFSEDESVKGDFNIQAKGSASLVAKELYAQQLEQFAAQTLNPADAPYVKRDDLLRQRVTAMDMDPDNLLYSDEEVAKHKQQAAEQPDPDRLKIDYDHAYDMGRLQLQAKQQAEQARIDAAKVALQRREQNLEWRENQIERQTKLFLAGADQASSQQ
jgi:hypothetical protein